MEKEDKKAFMAKAIELAEENVKGLAGGPFGAVVVKDGKIVGKGSNKVTVHNDPTAHAEIVAIRDAAKNLGTFDLSGCEIYSSCEPCPMCLGAIYWARFDKLYYAATKDDAAKANFDDSFIYKEFALPKEERSILAVQMMRENAVKVFEEWNQAENKIPY
ncbi:nucleoside deaminase [Candidatus Sulfidibacterium hydrothermale]|uniref:nucleoside deaminase n=1 Tax=Candidatus Sulfidibacterium hydrothermale TaxID=2875962 RepID=UPI001F0A3E73|nr:nucleoside deaminase [Candidatus Sulfidibacterium hydrothermale]UBM63294.1 nucleoside deaminase [Candidatus Sulfidibacterium hydrothermale]